MDEKDEVIKQLTKFSGISQKSHFERDQVSKRLFETLLKNAAEGRSAKFDLNVLKSKNNNYYDLVYHICNSGLMKRRELLANLTTVPLGSKAWLIALMSAL